MILPASLEADIRRRYGQPHRRYHTAEHLDEVLEIVRANDDLADDPDAVELAAWFHDLVYDPKVPHGQNEARSAAAARIELDGHGFDEGVVAEVERLVLLTAGHEVAPGDRNGALLADADLAILGAPPERYARYAADVRAEYAHVPDDAWRAGRAAVLRGFLDRPRLYRTDVAHVRFDAAARRNLTAELARLVDD